MVSYVVYLTVVILAAFAIPFPTNEQLKEAEKVVKQYIYENQGVELLNISSGPTAEMFDHYHSCFGECQRKSEPKISCEFGPSKEYNRQGNAKIHT